MEGNWKNGRHSLTKIECHSENSKGVYCLQYDEKKIVSGLRDNTIKVRRGEGEGEGGEEGRSGRRSVLHVWRSIYIDVHS